MSTDIKACAKNSLLRFENSSEKIIIECNRLNGDSFSFYVVYNLLKGVFIEKLDTKQDTLCTPMANFSDCLSEEQANEALKPILEMAENDSPESQLMASQILCELTIQDDMQTVLLKNNAVNKMARLVGKCRRCIAKEERKSISTIDSRLSFRRCDCTATIRLNLIGIAELSRNPLFCTQIISEQNLLDKFIELSIDGPYKNVHARRAAALALSNCSEIYASEIVKKIEREKLEYWFCKVSEIKDSILKTYAEKAAMLLREEM